MSSGPHGPIFRTCLTKERVKNLVQKLGQKLRLIQGLLKPILNEANFKNIEVNY